MATFTAEALQAKLKEKVPGLAFLSVEDTSDGCGAKFAAVVVSESFTGKTPIERHQSIMGNSGVLAEEMKTVSWWDRASAGGKAGGWVGGRRWWEGQTDATPSKKLAATLQLACINQLAAGSVLSISRVGCTVRTERVVSRPKLYTGHTTVSPFCACPA
jgi:stress-induced morphogen